MPTVDNNMPPVSQQGGFNTQQGGEQFGMGGEGRRGEKEEERMEQYDAEALAETYFDLARQGQSQ